MSKASAPTTAKTEAGIPLCPHCSRPLDAPPPVSFDADRHVVRANGASVHLSPSEFAIVAFLHAHHGRGCRRFDIYDHLYQLRPDCDQPLMKTIDVFLHRTRRKIAPLGLKIVAVWGGAITLECGP